MDHDALVNDAWAVREGVPREVWRAALDRHYQALMAFSEIMRNDSPTSPAWRDALNRLQQTWLDLQACWEPGDGEGPG